MKVLYATDLHGQLSKFIAVKNIIEDHDIVILGADILPKGQGTTDESIMKFIAYDLAAFFNSIKIPIIIDFGNDDWVMYYKAFKDIVDVYDHVYISHMNIIEINGWRFCGMHYVPDYPFGIKDWCRRDFMKVCDIEQFGSPWTSENGDQKLIPDLKKYFLSKPTIREELDNQLPKPNDEIVYIIHAPPRQSGLDVCFRNGPVGSYDVYNWIVDEKPFLTLHGHIHESFEITGIDMVKIGDTICINPGQKGGYGYSNFVYCEFNLNDVYGSYERKEVKE